ncbi:hypothetical protein N9115_01680 [bacterium]|nr:hypothetical protein [bacterium]
MRVVDPACAGDSHNRWLNFWGARQGEFVESPDSIEVKRVALEGGNTLALERDAFEKLLGDDRHEC